jgi:hypothetical protein
MIDSTPAASVEVVDECPARPPQPVVEADAGGQAEETLQDALAQSGRSAHAVTLECEQVLAGPEDRLDPLADRRQVRAPAALVGALGAHHEYAEACGLGGEGTAGVALVADQDPAALNGALEELEGDLALAAPWIGERERPRRPIGSSQAVQTKAPVPARVAAAVAVAGHVCERRALRRLAAGAAGHRRRITEQELVTKARALARENAHEPLDGLGEPAPTSPLGRLRRQLGEEVGEVLSGHREEPAVRGDAHDRLGAAEGDELGVRDPAAGVGPSFWQKVVGCAINHRAESVEVGVHRGLRADGVQGTVGFGLSASLSLPEADLVKSII